MRHRERIPLPPLETLKSLLHYDPDTGVFTWAARSGARSVIGTVAGHVRITGYRTIAFNGEKYAAHRLAWLYMTGEEPGILIDHVNGQRDDNRWENLRQATFAQNSANSTRQSNNTTGLKGVSVLPHSPNRWQAAIKRDGKNQYLGCFPTPELAHEAYMSAAKEAHGEFATNREPHEA